MVYSTSMIKIDGVWRHMLIVESETEVEFSSSELIDTFTDENGDVIQTIYYTEGLYKHKENNGLHYYWFLFSVSRMTVNGQPDDDALKALQVLGVEVGE